MTDNYWKELKLSIYLSEEDDYNGKPLYKAISNKLKELKVAGVTVFRGIYGFGQKAHIHSSDIMRLSTDLPILIQSIDKENVIKKAFEEIKPMISEGIAVMEPVRVVHIKNK